ncbi:MAG: cbb3-type cytochrome c oxidase subunit II [Verrucomicrobiota bacterium]
MPWLFLIVIPFTLESKTQPVAYAEEDEMVAGEVYPNRNVFYGQSDLGAKVYAAEGCAYCHTQMVRPTYAGPDMWREWGGRHDEGLARETRPEDYFGEEFAYLGYQRIGQDLSNVGHRLTAEQIHQHLWDPQSVDKDNDSGMPAYKHLYKKSSNGEYVPTAKAEALVDYLLSRKKDAKLPADQG